MQDGLRTRRSESRFLVFALLFPTLAVGLYFVVLAGHPAAKYAYGVSKAVQFLLPLLVLRLLWAERPKPRWTRVRGLLWGLGSGLGVLGLFAIVYFLELHDSELARETTPKIWGKIVDFGITTPMRYGLMALFLSFLHSFLEEYYWRWFVFGRLARRLGPPMSLVISSLGFMSHHVVVIAAYLNPEDRLLALLPLSLTVAGGGAFWAWLYLRSGRLAPSWISHVLVDLALMGMGYELIWGSGFDPGSF